MSEWQEALDAAAAVVLRVLPGDKLGIAAEIRSLKPTEAAPDPLTTCALCGQPAIGFGMADGKVLCHHETRHCYRRWTVYGDRPAAPEPVGCAACGWTAEAHRDGFESACPGFVSPPTGGVEGAK